MQTRHITPNAHEVCLADMDAWDVFAKDNADALVEAYGSVSKALTHATQGGLTLGGGSAPLVTVFFADEE